MARGSVDERVFELVRRMRLTADGMPRLKLQAFKALVREQYFMLLIDEAAALAAIPRLLPSGAEERRKALAILREIVTARGELSGEGSRRMERITRLFEADAARSTPSERAHAATGTG